MKRLHRAMNEHDIDAFVGCFDSDYASEQPAHPDRTFRGRDQVQKNWSAIFEAMPDFHAELLTLADASGTAWAEWHWTATQTDGTPFDWRGVTLFGIRDGTIAWGRLYMEPTEQAGAGIDAVVQQMTGEDA